MIREVVFLFSNEEISRSIILHKVVSEADS